MKRSIRNHSVFSPMSYSIGRRIAVVAAAILFTACGGETVPTSFNPDFRLIVPATVAVSGVADIDGLNTDAKWNDAFNLEMIDGVTVPGVIMQGVADASNLYLYFEIEESDLSSTDMVAVALNPSSTPTDNRLFLIKPCPTGNAGCPGTADDLPVDIDYFIDANNDGTWEPTALPAGVTTKSATSGGIVWTVEMGIPRGAPFNLPATAYFGLYTNILETTAFNIAAQYTWPFNNDAGETLIFGTPEDTPASTIWGNATLNTTIGNGVSISSNDISTNHGPSTISWDEPNTFFAKAHNYTSTGGSLMTASAVRATIRWANFGLPTHNSFQRIPSNASPAPGNPTAYQDILPTATAEYSLNWTVPGADQAFYQANPHWCVQVELDSSNVNTVFLRQQAQSNMNFAETSSPFVRKPTIDTLGLKLPRELKAHEYILQERFYNFKPGLRWESKLGEVKKVANATYSINIPPERHARFDLSVLPPAEALVPFENIKVTTVRKVGAADATKISVRPGMLVTLLADAIKVERQSRSATTNITHVETDKASPAPILMASWDGFERSQFAIGGSVSLKVPEKAKTLSISAVSEQNPGSPMNIRAYITPIEEYHLQANRSLKLDRYPNGIVNIAANLPTVIYRGQRNMGGNITIDKKTFTVHQSAGAFGYIVKGKKTE
jgi:hypothetical protein